MKRLGILFIGLVLACGTMQLTHAQTVRSEAANHPRIAVAIRELEGAIAYMEHAPYDFGGHKEAAIRDSRAAWNCARRWHIELKRIVSSARS